MKYKKNENKNLFSADFPSRSEVNAAKEKLQLRQDTVKGKPMSRIALKSWKMPYTSTYIHASREDK